MIATAGPTDEKPRIGKCTKTKMWFSIKDYVIGRGTTPKGAYQAMKDLHQLLYKAKP